MAAVRVLTIMLATPARAPAFRLAALGESFFVLAALDALDAEAPLASAVSCSEWLAPLPADDEDALLLPPRPRMFMADEPTEAIKLDTTAGWPPAAGAVAVAGAELLATGELAAEPG